MTRRLGLIVRSDFGGGLANQTWELHRHLEPDATLVMLMGPKGRPGAVEDPARYGDAFAVEYASPHTATMQEFLSRIDVLLSVETFYVPYLLIEGQARGIERILYANPELLRTSDPAEQADRYVWADPNWVHPFPAPGGALPWPCSTDREPRAEIGWPPRFVHVAAPAMLDRNGTAVVAKAAEQLRAEVNVDIYGSPLDGDYTPPGTHAHVSYRPAVADHWDLYADADLLVMPRRYGCLSLPILEAAAVGVPTLTTDLEPQRSWFARWAPWLLVPAGDPQPAVMKAGIIDVYQPVPGAFAVAMDRLAGRADVLDSFREEIRTWAEARSWEKMLPAWEAVVR